MNRSTYRTLLSSAATFAGTCLLAGSISAYPLDWTGLGGNDDFMNGNNWFNPAPYGVSFPPDAGSSVTMLDAAVSANATLYSGSVTIFDFTAYANNGPGGNTSLTVKSGATLHSTHNFDLGYFNGPETTTFTLESGANAIVDGYFGGGRAGPHTSFINGLLTTHILHVGGADQINLGATGVIVTDGDHFALGDITSDLNLWIGLGLITAPSGYGVNTAFDSSSGKTTISAVAVPEPVSGGVLAMGLALVTRRRTRKGARQQ